MEHLTQTGFALAAIAFGTFSPGPNIPSVVGTLMFVSRKTGIALAAGIAAGSFLWALSATIGLTALTIALPAIAPFIAVAGGVYLLWLAVQAFRAAASARPIWDPSKLVEDNSRVFFRRGLGAQMTSPKAALMWVAIMSLGLQATATASTAMMIVIATTILSLIAHIVFAVAYVHTKAKTVWLTFDDGPHNTETPKVLEVLAAHGIRATFFLIGKNAALYPALVQRIVSEGHAVGNHTYHHSDLTKLTSSKVREELQLTERHIAQAMGPQKLFRPPFGAHDANVDAVVADLGYRSILWNVDTIDWSEDFQPVQWVDRGVAQIKARTNSVVLNHDVQNTTAENLDAFIRKIKAIRGVRIGDPKTLWSDKGSELRVCSEG